MNETFRLLVASADNAVPIRYEQLQGREYLVVPTVMITEGVHEGSAGAIYYPPEELKESVKAWDHKPIVVYHPKNNQAEPISACTPTVLETQQVGMVLNTGFKDKKLFTESWIDTALANKVDKRILEAVKNNQMMEVSTGLYTADDNTKGVWNGEKYSCIARKHKPDHLAILPDQIGACSIADGAGLLRINNSNVGDEVTNVRLTLSSSMMKTLKANGIDLKSNELAFDQIRSQLYRLLSSTYGKKGQYWDGYIREVFPTYVIFQDEENNTWKQEYSVKNNAVTFSGTAAKVRIEINYVPVTNEGVVVKTNQAFNKKDHIAALIKANVFKPEQEKELEALPDFALEAIKIPVAAPEPTPTPKENVNPNIPVLIEKPATAPAAAPVAPAITWEQVRDILPPTQKAVFNQMETVYNTRKAALIETITANTANKFSKDYLESITDINLLEGMVALIPGSQPPAPMFFGGAQGGTTAPKANARKTPEGLKPTQIDWTNK